MKASFVPEVAQIKPVEILVVDDDRSIIDLLAVALNNETQHVIFATNGKDALRLLKKESPDIVVLDIIMPKMDGFEICERIRQRSQIPIIALSARGDPRDKIRCLNLGADDYITKPFRIDELVARINAVLRRSRTSELGTENPVFECGAIKIDFQKMQVFVKGIEKCLTPTEYDLLVELTTHGGETRTFNILLKKIWGSEFIQDRDFLYVHISHLREKIESDPKHPNYIVSIPRVGYRFQTRQAILENRSDSFRQTPSLRPK